MKLKLRFPEIWLPPNHHEFEMGIFHQYYPVGVTPIYENPPFGNQNPMILGTKIIQHALNKLSSWINDGKKLRKCGELIAHHETSSTKETVVKGRISCNTDMLEKKMAPAERFA